MERVGKKFFCPPTHSNSALHLAVGMKRDAGTAGLDEDTNRESRIQWLAVMVTNVPVVDVVLCRVATTGTVDDVKFAVADDVWHRSGHDLRTSSFRLEMQGRHVPYSTNLSDLPAHLGTGLHFVVQLNH